MAALTARRPRQPFMSNLDVVWTFPIAAGKNIFEGAFLGVNADGNVLPVNAADTLFAGIAEESVDNTLGLAAALSVKVRMAGRVTMKVAGATSAAAGVGENVYAADDGDANLTAAASTLLGKIQRWISDTTNDVVIKSSLLKIV